MLLSGWKEWVSVPAAACYTKRVWKTFTLIMMAKSDFVHSVATNSTILFIPSQQFRAIIFLAINNALEFNDCLIFL